MSPIHVPEPRLGLDIGRVIIAPSVDDREDTSFFAGSMESALKNPPNIGMFDHVPVLVQRFGGAVWLVSKAGPRIQERTLRWLEHHNFYQRTGIARINVRFCRERHEKAAHCSELGLTHFVDDRQDVLAHLEGLVACRFLFGPQEGPVIDKRLTRVATWAEASTKVMPQALKRSARRASR